MRAEKAKDAAKALFSGGVNLDNVPEAVISSEELSTGINVMDLVVKTDFIPSKSEARRLVEQNGISINQTKESDVNRIIDESDFKEGFIVIQKGKKVFLVGGPDDKECIETISQIVPQEKFKNLYGTTKNLKELAELISSASDKAEQKRNEDISSDTSDANKST